jgi:hypothetical protein
MRPHTPIRILPWITLAWARTKLKERGVPVFVLTDPRKAKTTILRFPMPGKDKGCVQVLDTPTEYRKGG